MLKFSRMEKVGLHTHTVCEVLHHALCRDEKGFEMKREVGAISSVAHVYAWNLITCMTCGVMGPI